MAAESFVPGKDASLESTISTMQAYEKLFVKAQGGAAGAGPVQGRPADSSLPPD